MTGGASSPVVGKMLAHYRVLEHIGGGAMGEIYLAQDTRLERKVALKVLPSASVSNKEKLQRFRTEARAAAAMNHPNIVTIHGVEETDGIHFLAMELVEGRTLREVIPRGGLPFDEFLRLAAQLTEAVATAHAAGITHRDLKPDNVMITQTGRVKVLDFGLAKLMDEGRPTDFEGATLADAPLPADDRLTSDGMLIGTIPYMSPEHVKGHHIDRRSDLFSLGIILYEMLTGERPFKGANPAAVMASILRNQPRAISTARPDVPEHLELAIALCLEKDPAERLQSAESLYEQLRILKRQYSSGGSAADAADAGLLSQSGFESASIATRTRRAVARHRLPLLLLTAVFMVNLVETTIETAVRQHWDAGRELGFQLARAAHWFEGGTTFAGWDGASALVVYGYSIAYFFVLLGLVVVTGWSLASRSDPRPFRIFALAVAVDYAISLPFFLFFPVPERWAWPDSGAILLSDLWAPQLIEIFRPFSGLDNCFPSFHVSLTTVVVGLAFVEHLRYRWTALWLSLLVILSTAVLGIHWLTDIAAGLATGILAVAIALLLERRIRWVRTSGDHVGGPASSPSAATSRAT
ncbi:MAG: protein kinase [Thermoanaerobaculales bacterium]|nr:protein kinase [Thermoanaerobaculales bacterium]